MANVDDPMWGYLTKLEKQFQQAFDKQLTEAINKKYDKHDDDRLAEYKKLKAKGKEKEATYVRHPQTIKMIAMSKIVTAVEKDFKKKNEGKLYSIKYYNSYPRVTSKKSTIKGRPSLLSIRPQIKVEVEFKVSKAGGGVYVTKGGETLAQISQDVYGNPFYADRIVAANKGKLLSVDKKFVMCRELILPKIDVPMIVKTNKGPKIPKPKGTADWKILNQYPEFEVSHSPKVPIGRSVVQTAWATAIVDIFVGGTFTMGKEGAVPAGFNFNTYKNKAYSIIKEKKPFEFTLLNLLEGKATVESKVFGKVAVSGSVKFSPRSGTLDFSASTGNYTTKVQDYVIKGKATVTLKVRFVPNVKFRTPERPWYHYIWEYKWQAIKIVALSGLALTGGGLIAIAGRELGKRVVIGGIVVLAN